MEDENNSLSAENQNKVEGHLEAASQHHIKAAENAVLTQEYLNLASELGGKN